MRELNPTWNYDSFAYPRRIANRSIFELIAPALAASLFLGTCGAMRAADSITVRDVAALRAAQQSELSELRRNYNGDIEAYRSRSAAIKERYLQQDSRGRYTEQIIKEYGGQIENTGSNPKDVRADVDLAAKTNEAADKLAQQWKNAGHHVEDHGYKVIDKTTDTTLWKPCNTPECAAAKVRDPDAWTTEGGLKSTGNQDRIRDPRGQYLDNAKKFHHAREDFAHATSNPNAIDELRAFDSVKTAAKSLDKVAQAAGIKTKDDFWQKVENIRNRYMDPWEAGIANPKDPPAKQVQDIDDFLAKAETKMAAAEEVLTQRAQVIDKQVREKLQEDLRNAKQADPRNKAMDEEGAKAIQGRRDKAAASNKPVEDFNTEQRARQPKKPPAPQGPESGTIHEPTRPGAGGEPPKGTAPAEPPPAVAGSEPQPPGRGATPTEQPPPVGGVEPAGPRPRTARGASPVEPVAPAERPVPGAGPSDAAAGAAGARSGWDTARSAGTGAAAGGLIGAATTYVTCMLALSPDATNENCLAAAGQSIPEAGFWGAVAALGPVGEAAAAIYGTYQTIKMVEEAVKEAGQLPAAIEAQTAAGSRMQEAQVDKQQEISRAAAACNYERALGLARGLQRQRQRPAWLATTLPNLEKGARAQSAVTALLARAAAAPVQQTRAQLMGLAQNAAAGVPCLVQRVQEVQNKLQPGGNEQHCIYVLNASGGSIWVGTESQLKARRTCDLIGGGRCPRGDKKPPQVMQQPGCYPTREAAVAAWCRELQGKNIETWVLAHNKRAKVYGGDYWLANAPGCPRPLMVALRFVQEQEPPPVVDPKITVSDASCEPKRNDALLGELRKAANAGSEKARATLPAFERVATAIASTSADIEAAQRAYDAGEFTPSRIKLAAARATLEGLDHKPACPGLTKKISDGFDRIKKVDDTAAKVSETIGACDVKQMTSRKSELAKSGHAYQSIVERLETAIKEVNLVNARMTEARAAFNRGEMDAARSQLRQAKDSLDGMRGRCAPTATAIDKTTAEIDKVQDAIDAAERASNGCDKTDLERSKASLTRVSNPAAKPTLVRLTAAIADCAKRERERAVDDANQFCSGSFGEYSRPIPKTIGGTVQCSCVSGYRWSSDRSWCERMKTKEEQIAEANESCREGYGDDSVATKQKRDGTFDCTCRAGFTWSSDGSNSCERQKTKEEVLAEGSAVCREGYGQFSFARKLNRDGTFDCWCDRGYEYVAASNQCEPERSDEEVLAEGTEECRQNFGSSWYAVSQNRDGTFQCERDDEPQPSTRRRRPQRPVYQPRPVYQQPSGVDAAAAAAAAAAVIGAITRSRPAPQVQRPAPQWQRPASQPQVRCHVGRDGRQHCGGG